MNSEIKLHNFRSYLTRSYLYLNNINTLEKLSKLDLEHFLKRNGVGQSHVNSINKVLKENGYPELYYKNRKCLKINYTVDNNGVIGDIDYSFVKSIEDLKFIKSNLDKLLEDIENSDIRTEGGDE